MAPRVNQAVLAAFQRLHQVHGEKATYRIGDVAIADIDVVPGASQAEAIDDNTGLVTTIDLQDFQLRADALQVDGQLVVPDRGHIIEVTRGDQVQQFVVNHPNLGSAPFKRADAYGMVLRVHTLQVAVPTPAAE